jgi:hypothetical protein
MELYVKGKIAETIPFSQIRTIEARKGLMFLHLNDSACKKLDKIDVLNDDNTFLLFTFSAGTHAINDTVPIFSYGTNFFPPGIPVTLFWENKTIIKDKKVFVHIEAEYAKPEDDRIKRFVDRLIDTFLFNPHDKL